MLRRAPRRSLTQEIIDQLLGLIAEGPAPEHRLPTERVIAERFGVSRTSLREALSVLSEWRVIEARGKAKYGVVSRARAQLATRQGGPDAERTVLADPLEARLMLEPPIAARAAERGREADLDEIERCLTAMEEAAAAGESVIAHDSAFHVAVASATGNRTLVQVVSALMDALQESRDVAYDRRDAAQVGIADHRHVLEAIRAHDPARARRAMRKHLSHVERLVATALAQAGDEQSPGAGSARR
ncbi:MAG: GntR family transcriptional regulator, transcriptional repressor for pyruvate dehydrogenase complex [Solirubrobacteraceae bacterium]|jgi:GntR family transcriptional repressor for pyruvate dehydrogenase complex|nr:GntR family transcriptional regulator, transcriptional repressor for pyruvate dehydrogenase complex [Solirubrobacteraceae bacterium]